MPPGAELLVDAPRPLATALAEELPAVARVAWYQVLRNAKMFLFFKVHAGLQLLQSVAHLLIFLYLGQLVGADRLAAVADGNYASFLVIGVVLLQVLDKSLIGPYASLSGAYWSARLESLMLSPHSLWVIVSTDTLWYYVMTTVNAAVILAVGLTFGASFGLPSSWLLFVVVLSLGAASVFGLGLISASTFSLLNAKGRDEPVSWAVHLLEGLVSGLYFPFELLPTGLKVIGLLLPHTYAIDAGRRLFLHGFTSDPTLPVHGLAAIDPVLIDCACLAVATALLLPVGTYLFNRGVRKSRQVGTLSRWT